MSSISKSLTRFLATPSKIAHALDWNKNCGSVLSVHIGTKSIDLAVTAHPSTENPIQPLPSIPIESETKGNQKVLKGHVLEELSNIVKQFKVCGIVMSWPVQKEGWCGAPCGRVLHTLDQIVQETRIVSRGRPVCLWDGHHFSTTEDEWGRVPLYSVPSKKAEHRASQEQYREDGMVAADIAKDYIRNHWPEFVRKWDKPSSSTGLNSAATAAASAGTAAASAGTGKPKTVLVDPSWIDAYTTCAM